MATTSPVIPSTGRPPDAVSQLQSLPFPHILIDPDGRIARANPAAENFLSQSLKRLIGRELSGMLAFSDSRITQALQDPDTTYVARTAIIRTPDAREHSADISIAPVAQFTGWRGVTFREDISPRHFGGARLTGENDLRLQSPDILAHEIKNPLAGIKGAAQLLERRLCKKDASLTQLIREEVNRITSLLDQMQTLGRQKIDAPEPCNIHEILAHVRAVVLAGADHNVIISEHYDPSLPTISGSPGSLSQILVNLLTNAMAACADEVSPQIIISTRYTSGVKFRLQGQDAFISLPIEVTVSDNGPGADESISRHLFEPFVTTKKNGQGLGLALVRKLVSDMQGRVYYERDTKHELSHFRMLLPSAEHKEAKSI